MASGHPPASTNRLLDRLSQKDRAHVLARCERVDLVPAQVLAEPGTAIRHVYFPTAGYISLVAFVGDESGVEVSLAGREGFYGLPVVIGVPTSPSQAVVQGAGTAWRMETALFRRELESLPDLRTTMNRYTYVVMRQFMNSAGCNRFHLVEHRLARWLLMTADRVPGESFPVTHEILSRMLGVRRVGITEAATALQNRGLIAYRHGTMSVIDHEGLEGSACSCYRANRNTYDQVLGRKKGSNRSREAIGLDRLQVSQP